jgi:hypothetical protein
MFVVDYVGCVWIILLLIVDCFFVSGLCGGDDGAGEQKCT